MSTQTRSPRFRHVMNTVRVKYLQLTSATDNANIKNIKQSSGCADQKYPAGCDRHRRRSGEREKRRRKEET